MKEAVKKILPKPILMFLKRIRAFLCYIRWLKQGKPYPCPHIIKQREILKYQKKYQYKTLVETGTYYGDMVFEMKGHFNDVYSIELSEELYKKARERFKEAKNVHLIYGDSGIELAKIIRDLQDPAIFWLDGHYSAGVTAKGEKNTPIYNELTHILKSDLKHVILIDDARCFGKTDDYPTIEELKSFILKNQPNAQIEVNLDIIRVLY